MWSNFVIFYLIDPSPGINHLSFHRGNRWMFKYFTLYVTKLNRALTPLSQHLQHCLQQKCSIVGEIKVLQGNKSYAIAIFFSKTILQLKCIKTCSKIMDYLEANIKSLELILFLLIILSEQISHLGICYSCLIFLSLRD